MDLKLTKSQFRHRCQACKEWIEAGVPHYKHPRTLYHYHSPCKGGPISKAAETIQTETPAEKAAESLSDPAGPWDVTANETK